MSADDLAAPRTAVTVVVPTRNESPNVELLVDRLAHALGGDTGWEVIFVDDSDDDTPDAIVAQRRADRAIRLHHRPAGQRFGGLGGAVQDGFAAAGGEVIVVMDGDLQHPPEAVPTLLATIGAGEADLVVGTRYAGAGIAGGLSGPWRRGVSSTSRMLVHALIPRSRPLTDPLSGLFAFKRSVIEGVTLEANGFKILLEVVARGRWHRAVNVAYRFDRRYAGRSKASLHQGLLFTQHLIRLANHSRQPLHAPPPVVPSADSAAAPAGGISEQTRSVGGLADRGAHR